MSENPPNGPALVRIPFANAITSKYAIVPGPLDPNAGNGRHIYEIVGFDENGQRDWSMSIAFQMGNPATVGHNGIITPVLLTVLIDHLKSFQAGPFVNRETECAIKSLEEAMHWIAARADDRAARGVLGEHKR